MTAEAVTSAPVGEAGFRLLADQLPDLIILAFDRELVMWAATGGGLRGNGWTPENFVGLRLPEKDPTSDELAISEEMTRILGLEPGSRLAMGEVVARFVHPADLDRVAASMDRRPTDPTPFPFEHRMVRGDGAIRSVPVRGEGVVDEDGRVVRFIGTDQDVTDRRRADAERRRLLGRVYEAQEGQDRRLAADLHDGHVQSLFRVAQQALANVVDPTERWGA